MEKKRNVLIIMSDQHNKHVMGCAGDPVARTPHIDRLARDGVRFDDAYCPAPLCVPCRASFLTSRFPSNTRVWENSQILSPTFPTWPQAAGLQGYETALIGRMHLSWPHQYYGFSRCLIGELQGFPYFQPGVRFPRPNPPRGLRSISLLGQELKDVATSGWGSTYFQWQDERIAEAACEYLGSRAGDSGSPFVAVVGFFLPHCIYAAPKDLFDHYYDRVSVPRVEESLPPTIRRFREKRGLPTLSDEAIRRARAAYYGLCELVDTSVGRIMGVLEKTGLLEETLVIYCADHGDSAGEHGCWWKSNYYEGSAGVPLIMRFPDSPARGLRSRRIANLVDIGPTVLDYIGAAPMGSVDGRTLLPGIEKGDSGSDKAATFSELAEAKYTEPDRYIGRIHFPSRMIRQGEWKLWRFADEENLPPAMFNLRDDPNEERDLGCDPRYSSVREELLHRLMADWDPQWVKRTSEAATVEARQVRSWFGKVLAPSLRDGVDWLYNDPHLEDDLTLI